METSQNFFLDVVLKFKLLFNRTTFRVLFFSLTKETITYGEVGIEGPNRREKKESVSQANITLSATCGKLLSSFTSAQLVWVNNFELFRLRELQKCKSLGNRGTYKGRNVESKLSALMKLYSIP